MLNLHLQKKENPKVLSGGGKIGVLNSVNGVISEEKVGIRKLSEKVIMDDVIEGIEMNWKRLGCIR